MKKSTVLVLALATVVAQAQITIDGTRDAAYGAALAVQQNGTQFGDSNLGNHDTANGSELDAAYGVIGGGNLYLMLTGNLETNFNKLNVYIDTGVGGQNQLANTSTQGNQNNETGMKFDAGFNPSVWLSITGGGGPPPNIFVDFAAFNGSQWNGSYLGTTGYASNGVLTGGTSQGIKATIDNANTGGVSTTQTPITNPATVTTGAEMAIPLSVLGNPTGPIKVSAFVNGSGNDYLSNQFLGSLPAGANNTPYANLGAPGVVDLSQIPGNQYFTVVPEPASMIGLSLGVLALIKRRRARK